VYAKVVKVVRWGVFLEIVETFQGCFIHPDDLDDADFYNNSKYGIDTIFKVKIKVFKPKHSRYNVEIVNEHHFALMT
jgi:hypothetical protein